MSVPAAAQETAQQVYDAYFVAFAGNPIDTYPEYVAGFTIEAHLASIQKEETDLPAAWTADDSKAAIATFGAPVRSAFKAQVMRRLVAALPIADAKAAAALASDPAALKTINCVNSKADKSAAAWTACAADGGRSLDGAEQDLSVRATAAINAVLANPDFNSATVGIVCHTLDRFGQRMSSDGATRTYSVTLSVVTAEEPIGCERAKPRYAALIGHDAYLALQPSLLFKTDKKD